jgi:hypothetical protein
VSQLEQLKLQIMLTNEAHNYSKDLSVEGTQARLQDSSKTISQGPQITAPSVL